MRLWERLSSFPSLRGDPATAPKDHYLKRIRESGAFWAVLAPSRVPLLAWEYLIEEILHTALVSGIGGIACRYISRGELSVVEKFEKVVYSGVTCERRGEKIGSYFPFFLNRFLSFSNLFVCVSLEIYLRVCLYVSMNVYVCVYMGMRNYVCVCVRPCVFVSV